MAKLSSTDRVLAAANRAGLDIEIVEMPASTRTAEEAAAACGCSVAEIVKSLVYLGAESDTVVLLLVSGVNRVDEAAVGRHLGVFCQKEGIATGVLLQLIHAALDLSS